MPIQEIIISNFGLAYVKPKLFNEIGEEIPAKQNSEFPAQKAKTSSLSIKENQRSWLGTKVFSDCILDNGNEQIYLDALLIEVSRKKTIVTTTVVGKNNTVKEFITNGDYDIKLQGALHRSTNEYPQGDVEALIKILSSSKEVKVICRFLRFFDIYNIVITDYNLQQKEGRENIQLFEISAISDEPIELVKDA